jgi:predicted GH43/DUF377 family glycosyl hydrolase
MNDVYTLSRRRFLQNIGATVSAAAVLSLSGEGEPMELSEKYKAALERVRTPYKFPELVMKPSYKAGEYDALAVDCPFVFKHKRRFYMTHIGFDGKGYRTGLAWSKDLLKWEKEGMIIDRGPAGSVTEFNAALTWILRDNELFGTGELKTVDGRLIGTYHAYPRPGYESGPAAIGICRTKDFHKWDIKPPVMQASDEDAGDWERGGLYKSCLLEHEGTYYMFYNAKTAGEPWMEQIGLATSPDLRTWKRHPGNPVIPVGPKGSFDDIFCSDPCVLRCGDVWVMFFYTLGSDGRARDTVAFSDDLLTWHKSNEILIDVGQPGSIDSRYAHKPSVFSFEGRLYHFYCAVAPSEEKKAGDESIKETRGIAVARS